MKFKLENVPRDEPVFIILCIQRIEATCAELQPPVGVTQTSSWPWLDHPGSGP